MAEKKIEYHVHPSTKEGFTDYIYRYAQEMVKYFNNCMQDFEGQQLADKVLNRGMIATAVIYLNFIRVNIDNCIRCGISNIEILKYSLHNACLYDIDDACNNCMLINLLDYWYQQSFV